MAKIRGGIVVGKIGNVVYSEWKGIEVLKTAPVRSKNSWSERQVIQRQRFKAISEYCNNYRYTLIPQIWNLAAKNMSGRNLFLKANAPAFALDGELTAVDKLHFSAGDLPLPQQFTAKRKDDDPFKVEVTWTIDDNLSPVYLDDELMLVAGNADKFTGPIATGVLRKKGSAVISLRADPENFKSIWLLFRAYKKDGYSWNQWFGI
jgi:hypothetical protein